MKPPARHIRFLLLGIGVSLAYAPGLRAQIARAVPPPGVERHTAPVAERYGAGGLKRWLLGDGYRDLWSTPIDIPVLDLDSIAGGLTPVEEGGFGQTVTLEFLGADGLEYAVRSIDKTPTRRLDPLLQNTVIAAIVQDQVSTFLPTAALVVDPLLEATGVLHPKHRLVVIPDDARLGEFREEFAGLIGLFVDRPQEREDDTPGFAGSAHIADTRDMLEDREEEPCHRFDARAYLKARLMDLVVGDRDRHPGQWRWARYPDGPDCFLWQPIPEDRDQAFIHADGFFNWVYRFITPRQVKFESDYPSLIGLTFNGWELDRNVLAELERPVWDEVAREIQARLTDAVIADAVRRLPEPHYRLVGARLERALEERRDDLLDEALDYYELISREAEIIATDRDEVAVFEHRPSGELDVTVRNLDGQRSAEPYFSRRYTPEETSEVRLYLQGGDDRVEVRGEAARITVRAIGGGGDDRFENRSRASRGRTRFYDASGDNQFQGRAKVDRREYRRPPSNNLVHAHALDWGGIKFFFPRFAASPDVGLLLGGTVGTNRYGFRKVPWAQSHSIHAGVATAGPEFLLGWDARYRDNFGQGDGLIHVAYSGINILRFHGFGNESSTGVESDFFKVEQREFVLAPGIEWNSVRRAVDEEEIGGPTFLPTTRFGVGPVLKYADTPVQDNADRFIGTLDPRPLGVGGFGQLGGRAWVEFDTRDNVGYATRGIHVAGGGSLFPAIWDVDETFGALHGSASLFLTPGAARGWPTLALRAGAKRVWGGFPFHEAAFLGGNEDLRGFREERFAGEAAAFGNAELRLPLFRFDLLLPAEFGVLGAADVGRVFFDGDPDDADSWHTGFGGGIWFSFLNRAQTLSLTVVDGEDLTGVYLRAGLHF